MNGTGRRTLSGPPFRPRGQGKTEKCVKKIEFFRSTSNGCFTHLDCRLPLGNCSENSSEKKDRKYFVAEIYRVTIIMKFPLM